MDQSKDKSSRTGSRSNLNESSVPLLLDEELEKIELKEKASTAGSEHEKDDSKTEKQDGESDSTAGAAAATPSGEGEGGEGSGKEDNNKDSGKKSKAKKAPKPKKEPKVHQRQPSCVNTLSVGLNLLERDDKHVNDHINIQFEDIISEPDSNHSFDAVWRLTYVVFSATKFWSYRLLAALVALPCAIFCGLNFALLSCCNVWAVSPALRILQVNLHFVKRVWSMLFRTVFDPIFQSVGMLFSNISIQRSQGSV